MSDSDEDRHGPTVSSGTLVPWSENGIRDERIVDWLDSHEEERNCLFSPIAQGRPRALTKLECYQKVSDHVFSIDEEASVRNGVKKEGARYRQIMAAHIRKFPHTYRRINDELGSSIVHKPFETLRPVERRKVEDVLDLYRFSIWKRLHKYWRVMAHFNKYWRPQRSQSIAHSASASGGTPRAPICIDIEDSEDDSKKRVKSEASPALPPKSGLRRKRKTDDLADDTPESKAVGVVKFDEDEPTTPGISSREEFQLRMETLAYKKQKLELEHEEKKLEHEGKKMDLQRLQLEAEMQRQRDEHEIKLFLLKK